MPAAPRPPKDTSGDNRPAAQASQPRQKGKGKAQPVRFVEGDPQVFDTFTSAEYERPLEPGADHADLRALFFHNQQALEAEQQREAEDYCETRRMRNFYVSKARGASFGFKLAPIPRDMSLGYLFLEGSAVVDIEVDGPVGQTTEIRSGDRLVKVNGQWVLTNQHANYLLFDLLRRARALDLTICRGEPLPPAMDLRALSDKDLEQAALDHLGLRADLAQHTHTRKQLEALVRRRFTASTNAALSNLAANQGEDDEDC
jgi:hypothetical protein